MPVIAENRATDRVEDDPAAFRDLRVAPVEIALEDPAAVAGLIRAQVSVRLAP